MLIALALPATPCRHQHDYWHAVRAGDGADLNGQLVGHGGDGFSKAPQNRSGLREGVDQHAGHDVGQFVQTNAHLGYGTEISAAATQGPEQIFVAAMFGSNDASIRQDNFSGKQISSASPNRPINGP